MIYNGKVHTFTADYSGEKMYLWLESSDNDEVLFRYTLASWSQYGSRTSFIKLELDKTLICHPHAGGAWVEVVNPTREEESLISQIKEEFSKYITNKLEEAVFGYET